METYTIEQLGLFITLCMAGCGGLLAIVWKSRCKRISTPCVQCDRDVPPKPEPEVVP